MNFDRLMFDLAPEVILLLGACASLAVGVMRSSGGRRWVSPLALATIALALVGTIVLDVPDGRSSFLGLWLTPLTYYTRLIALSIGGLIVLVNWHQPADDERGEYMAMILVSLLGLLLTASANDLIVLFFAVELVSVPTYVLIALSRLDHRASESAVKYFFLGAMSAAVLAYGMTFLYGSSGTTTLHMVVAGVATPTLPAGDAMSRLTMIGWLLVLGGLAFKIAAVPFHAYAPDVYEGAASPVTGLLGFVPKFAGFLALIKIISACNWDLPQALNWTLWCLAAVTMTVGNVMALLQQNVKRMLAYSGVAHTGYMLIALLVGPVAGEGPMHDGIAAMLFYIALYGAMNLGAFALLTAFRIAGRDVETLRDLSGLATRAPLAALALAICTLSLMGLPPTAGFLGKLYIFSSAFSLPVGHAFRGPMIALVIIGVVNAAIGAAYYLRMIAAVYMRPEAKGVEPAGGAPVRWALALCSAGMIVLFAWPAGLTNQARNATVVLRESVRSAPTIQVTRFERSPFSHGVSMNAENASTPGNPRGLKPAARSTTSDSALAKPLQRHPSANDPDDRVRPSRVSRR